MKKTTFLFLAVGIVTISMIWIALTPILFPEEASGSPKAAPHPGFFAPDVTLPTIEGEAVSLSDYRGRVVLVFLWASWCSVCKSTMPGLHQVYQDFAPQGFEILAINTTFQDNLAEATRYFQSQQYSYRFLLDQDGSTAREYQLHALPTAILIDQDGIVVDVVIGSGISSGFLRSQLDQFLAER